MARQKHKAGHFIRLKLADGSFGYGRLLEKPYVALYDHKTPEPEARLDELASKHVLFTLAVSLSALDAWTVIGWKKLEGTLTRPVVQFRQDVGDFRRCTIFDTAGNKRSASPQECLGLERAAVWEKDSVEERLLDTLLGRPNEAVEHLKVRLS